MPENDVITVADLDAQIDALREQEQSVKRQARDLEKKVKDEIRPELYMLVALKKKLTGKRAASA